MIVAILALVFGGCDELLGAQGPDLVSTEHQGKSFSQLKALAQEPSFSSMMRTPEKFKGELVYLSGEISQVISIDEDAYQMTMAITEGEYFWSDNVFLLYSLDRGPRLLEDDMVEIVGIFTGIYEAESVIGKPIQAPKISVIKAQ